MNLLQEYKLISLDTFKKYRYSSIINGNTEITEYDIDESEYEHPVTEALRILDRNTADLMVDEYRKEVERAKAELAEAKAEAKAQVERAKAEAEKTKAEAKAEAEEKIKAGEQEIKRLKEELARLRKE